MNFTQELQEIARYLTTRRESKNHGGYLIYEEIGKIQIALDTYVPNTSAYVWLDGSWKLVYLYNGAHGRLQESHSGEWMRYVSDVLYPIAKIEKKRVAEAEERERQDRLKKLHGSVNDQHLFSNSVQETV